MPPRKVDREVEVVVGPPICPAGITLCVRVPSAQAGEAMLGLVALVRAAEPTLRLRPHEKPRAEVVPGGTPCGVDDGYGEDCRRVGY
jgi:hypothetical protein